jgi:hypothetical protein
MLAFFLLLGPVQRIDPRLREPTTVITRTSYLQFDFQGER